MRRALLCVAVLAAASVIHADEGMWQPAQLPALAGTLESLGLEIDPVSLSDLTKYPMNAVISLGGCTASFVSPDGLVVTNHHCVEGSIQYNSTMDRDLLENGFLAGNLSEELPATPGTRVWVSVSDEDVTPRILDGLGGGLSGRERYQKIEDREKELVAECEKDPGHRCGVHEFYGGLQYRLIKRLEIRDVRLVYAPSRSIGVYGGDIDNWMWPRHTGDFGFYRAYVGKDGKPADYSKDNVPYHPASYLKVSAAGVHAGDFVMVAGYPGRTSRYRLAKEVEDTFGWYYPVRKKLMNEWLDVIGRTTAGSGDAAIKYASMVSRLNNSTKNYDGMLAGFAKSDIIARKEHLESDLQRWIQSDPDHGAKYHSALSGLIALVDEQQATRERDMIYGFFARRSGMLQAAETLYRLSREKEKPDAEREPGYQERDLDRIRAGLSRIDRTYDPAVDRAVWRGFILDYAAIPAAQHVGSFDAWFGIQGNKVDDAALDRTLDSMYAGTKLGDAKARMEWLEAPRAKFESSEDPFIRLAVKIYDDDMRIEEARKDRDGRLELARRNYMEALTSYLKSLGRPVYADANGTLRVTYGTIEGYSPRDGVAYSPFTTLKGIVEKNTGKEPFDAPQKELDAERLGNFGRFYDESLGDIPVNFLSTVDTTGGNSGSPTLNARGELVGLLFDGNWESIIADWDFNPALTRSIHVDIRYALWVMQNMDGATRLMDEMGIPPKAERSASLGGGK